MPSIWGERLAGIGAIGFGLYMMWTSWNYPVGGHMFPVFATFGMVLLGAAMILQTFLRPDGYDRSGAGKWEPASLFPLLMTGLALGYFLLVFWLGYFASTFLFLLATPFVLGLRRPWPVLLSAAAASGFIYLVFQVALRTRLPAGLLM